MIHIHGMYWFLFASLLITVSAQDQGVGVGFGAGEVVDDSTTLPRLRVESFVGGDGVPSPPLVRAVDRLAAHEYYIWFTPPPIADADFGYHLYYIDLNQKVATEIDQACWIKNIIINNALEKNSTIPLQRITLHLQLQLQQQTQNSKAPHTTTTAAAAPPNPDSNSTAATLNAAEDITVLATFDNVTSVSTLSPTTAPSTADLLPSASSSSSSTSSVPPASASLSRVWSTSCILSVSSTLSLRSSMYTFGLTAYNSVGESEYLYFDPANFNDESDTYAEINDIIVNHDIDDTNSHQQTTLDELHIAQGNFIITLALLVPLLVLLLIGLAIVSFKYHQAQKINKKMDASAKQQQHQHEFHHNPAINTLNTEAATTVAIDGTVDIEMTSESASTPPSPSPSASTVIPGMV